ncbi:DNA-binding protein HU-beta [Nonomuraea maritima]|uniref:DNA-binding protein HU-beta n=1 Tax=Nonomuraea maritima TaxID=683260 RepID=A0A1G9MN39_9ACTN|nr:HU family DNA-binding protein [Nonomuraea maritima]SDL75534.1 DNA-binding protein HU-beta [Nonomuraea maritima]
MAKRTKDDVAKATGVTMQKLNEILDYIVGAVAAGDTVQLTGAFTVKPVEAAARTVRVPSTGETMTTKPKRVPRFSAGSDWKRVVAAGPKS